MPKGVPLEPGDQRLAVHVEDHPLSYATFEGTIPAGEYGAGSVEIWDQGTYELVEEKRDGGLTVRLHGQRLEGLWTLVPAKLSGDPKNWLLLKKREPDERPRRASGSEPLTPRYDPMLATLAKEVPRGKGWVHEVKWDGYRVLAYVEGGTAKLFSRRRNSLTERFPTVATALPRAVRTPSAVLDGEVVTLDETGRASFSAMQQGGAAQLLYVFDVLEVDGEPVHDLPYTERRERLAELLDPNSRIVRLSEAFEDGEALYEAAKEQELEGIVSKRSDSRYEPGKRSRAWLKVKATGRQEFLIAGYTSGEGRRAGTFGSLVLAVREGDELKWVGNVGTGFGEKEIDRLLGLLRQLERETSPFPVPPKMPRVRARDVHWVEPKLVAEVEFVEWTHDGHLRAPSYVGLREDKAPEEVEREEPAPHRGGAPLRPQGAAALEPRQAVLAGGGDHEGRPARVLPRGRARARPAPEEPAVHDEAVPRRLDRATSSSRRTRRRTCPSGSRGGGSRSPPATVPRTRRWISAPLVNDEPSLLWMVNMGCIDMNAWYSRVDRPDRPDWVLFDLDPSPDVGFPETVQVALLVKEILDALGLVGFAKTSGSRGIHVLVPVERRYTYDETREFAEIVAGALARTHRGLVTTEWTKSKRRGVLIDANQNGEGKTIASVYSVRPRAGAPVSTPFAGRSSRPTSTRARSRWRRCSSASGARVTSTPRC